MQGKLVYKRLKIQIDILIFIGFLSFSLYFLLGNFTDVFDDLLPTASI